jgi:hypothetical protein
MTAAPYASPKRRVATTAFVCALLLGLGLMALEEFGLGPALFLFALVGVGVIDVVQVLRRDARRRRT